MAIFTKPLPGQTKALGAPSKVYPSTVLGSLSVTATGAGTYTIPATGWLLAYAWGAGGSGGAEGGAAGTGGGTGAACYARRKVYKGQVISYSVGAGGAGASAPADGSAGGDTTVTMPGIVLRAGGGQGGKHSSFMPGGVGGIAYTGDIRRPGNSAAASGGATYTDGAVPVGWVDLLTFIPNGTSSVSSPFGASAAATQPGAASGAAGSTSGNGGDGRVFLLLMS